MRYPARIDKRLTLGIVAVAFCGALVAIPLTTFAASSGNQMYTVISVGVGSDPQSASSYAQTQNIQYLTTNGGASQCSNQPLSTTTPYTTGGMSAVGTVTQCLFNSPMTVPAGRQPVQFIANGNSLQDATNNVNQVYHGLMANSATIVCSQPQPNAQANTYTGSQGTAAIALLTASCALPGLPSSSTTNTTSLPQSTTSQNSTYANNSGSTSLPRSSTSQNGTYANNSGSTNLPRSSTSQNSTYANNSGSTTGTSANNSSTGTTTRGSTNTNNSNGSGIKITADVGTILKTILGGSNNGSTSTRNGNTTSAGNTKTASNGGTNGTDTTGTTNGTTFPTATGKDDGNGVFGSPDLAATTADPNTTYSIDPNTKLPTSAYGQNSADNGNTDSNQYSHTSIASSNTNSPDLSNGSSDTGSFSLSNGSSDTGSFGLPNGNSDTNSSSISTNSNDSSSNDGGTIIASSDTGAGGGFSDGGDGGDGGSSDG